MKAILETHTLASLKNLVRTHNIRGYSTMKKAELIRVMTSPQHYGKFAGTKTYVKPPRKPRQPKPAPKPKGQQGRKPIQLTTFKGKPTKPPQPKRPPPTLRVGGKDAPKGKPEPAPKPIPPSYNDITKGKPKMPSRKPPTRKIRVKPRLKSSRPAPKAPSKAPSRQSSSDYDAEVREVKIDGIDYLYDSDNDEYYDYETHTQIPNPRKKKKTKKAATKDEGKAPKKSATKDDKPDVEKSIGELHGFGNVKTLGQLFKGLGHIEPNLVNKIIGMANPDELSERAFKEIGDKKENMRGDDWNPALSDDDPRQGSRAPWTTLDRYKSGKKKGKVKSTRMSWEGSERKDAWYDKQHLIMAKKYGLPKDWDERYRKKHGHMKANELETWR